MLPWTLRPVTPTDLDLVCEHRERMFIEAGRDPVKVDQMRGPFRQWASRHLASGHYFGFIAQQDDRAIGGIGLLEIDWAPHPFHADQPKRGYILNVFVEPEHRGTGCARALMQAGEEELRRRGIAYAVLHASDLGRPLYEKTGWNATNEMSKRLLA